MCVGGGGARGFPPGCATSQHPPAVASLPPSYEPSTHSTPGQDQSSWGWVRGLSWQAFTGSGQGVLPGARGGASPPASCLSQPASLLPPYQPAALLAKQVLDHLSRAQGIILARPASSGNSSPSLRPTSQEVGEQKHPISMCSAF